MKLAIGLMAALLALSAPVAISSSAEAKTVVRSTTHNGACTTKTVRVREHGVIRTRKVRNCAPVRHVAPHVVIRTPVVRTGVYVSKPRHHCVSKTVTVREHGVTRRVVRKSCT